MVAWVASKNGVAEENITVDLALDTCKLDRRSTLAHYGIVEGNTQLTVVVSPDEAPVLVDSSNGSDYQQHSSQASSASDSSEVSSTPDLPHFLLTFLVMRLCCAILPATYVGCDARYGKQVQTCMYVRTCVHARIYVMHASKPRLQILL